MMNCKNIKTHQGKQTYKLYLGACVVLCGVVVSAVAVAQNYLPSGRLPKITIGGKQVLTNEQMKHNTVDSDLPEALKNDRTKMAIENRRRIQIWNHTPFRGPVAAPITWVEMNDMSCLYCQDLSQRIDEIFKKDKYKGKIQHFFMHLPVDKYNFTNAAAFYGRLAFGAGEFWDYRQSLYNVSSATDNIFTEKLISVGVPEKEIRRMTRKNARQYYKELDADRTAVQSMGEHKPPVLYVNGIKIGGSITLEQLESLMDYEIKLYERSL